MSTLRLSTYAEVSREQARRAGMIFMAVAVCFVAADVVTLIRTPFLNGWGVVALCTSLTLFGASFKLYRDNRPGGSS
jgi:uncharacterized membrane protein